MTTHSFGMTQVAVVASLALVLALIPATVGADTLLATKNRNFTVGGGNDIFSQLSWAAHGDVTGTNVSGYFRTDNFENVAAVQGHVICLRVVGNNATVGFQIEKATNLNPSDSTNYVGQFGYFFVQDNGNPAGSVRDLVASLPIMPTQIACPPPVAVTPLVQGNAIVYDSTAAQLLCIPSEITNEVGSYYVDGNCDLYSR